MKVQYMSDLHLEFDKPAILGGLGEFEIPVRGEVLILAGDISLGNGGCPWINSLGDKFEHVFYVLGNHEFYHNEWNDVWKNHLDYPYKNNVHFLNLDSDPVKFKDTLFVGDILWTDLANPDVARLASWGMNDYRICRKATRPLTPEDTTKHHHKAVSLMDSKLQNKESGNLDKLVVITHHAPHPKSIHPMYQKGEAGELNPAYYTDLTWFIEKHKPNLWVHGHTHTSLSYRVDKTKVVCNPRGYWPSQLNPDFDNSRVEEF